MKFFAAAWNDASVQGEADASKASRLIHCDLYGLVVDNGWKGASATAKSAGATLQHGQAETHGRQADCRRDRFLSRPSIYCAMANAGYDFLWIEMQHSPLTYEHVARMIWACRGAPAMPFIRVPDATESDIQKATDIGAVGIIVPTVDTVEKAQAAVKWSKYPPEGRRSQGNGQYGALWGNDYRETANEIWWW